MPTSLIVDPVVLNKFKQAGATLTEPAKSEQIVMAILTHFRDKGELTVYDETGLHELFRVGPPFAPESRSVDPRHGIKGVHIHEANFNPKTGIHSVKSGKATSLAESSVRELIVEELLSALSKGNYRLGFR